MSVDFGDFIVFGMRMRLIVCRNSVSGRAFGLRIFCVVEYFLFPRSLSSEVHCIVFFSKSFTVWRFQSLLGINFEIRFICTESSADFWLLISFRHAIFFGFPNVRAPRPNGLISFQHEMLSIRKTCKIHKIFFARHK